MARPERRATGEASRRAAGEVLTAKQAPHRPGTALALGLRAGERLPFPCTADRLQRGDSHVHTPSTPHGPGHCPGILKAKADEAPVPPEPGAARGSLLALRRCRPGLECDADQHHRDAAYA